MSKEVTDQATWELQLENALFYKEIGLLFVEKKADFCGKYKLLTYPQRDGDESM